LATSDGWAAKAQPSFFCLNIWRENHMQTVAMMHIELDDNGVAWIRDANTKVIEVVRNKQGGWSAEEICKNHPHLSLAQIYAALSYYYDHKEEIDADIARRDREVEEKIAKAENRFSLQELLERAKSKGISLY